MTMQKYSGDAMFAGSVGVGSGGIFLQLEPVLTVIVLVISAIAGIYSILLNRKRYLRSRSEQSKRIDT